jgi:hypothetical protein
MNGTYQQLLVDLHLLGPEMDVLWVFVKTFLFHLISFERILHESKIIREKLLNIMIFNYEPYQQID